MLIYPQVTIDYFKRVQQQMGRPAPSGHFEVLVEWVEKGEAAKTLDAIRRDQSGEVVKQ